MVRLISKYLSILVMVNLLMLIGTEPGLSQSNQQIHTVEQGETLFSISRMYEVTVGDLRRWNQLESDELNLGQQLRVAAPKPEGDIEHEVQPGETLFGISRLYNVSIAELQEWNNLPGANIEIGQTLIIYTTEENLTTEALPPEDNEEAEQRESIVRKAAGTQSTYYIVKSGDSLFKIAREHNMTIEELRQLNDLQSDVIRVGQRLTVRDVRSAPSVAESSENSTPQGTFVIHRVRSGESLTTLLENFKMSENELIALNPDIEPSSLSPGQRLTVLLPPARDFDNPYRKGAGLENLGRVPVLRYDENNIAKPTTSGELYNPGQLTAAHSNISMGTVLYIENRDNGRGIYVRVNDRISGDGLKLSEKAFDMLAFSSLENPRVAIFMDQ